MKYINLKTTLFLIVIVSFFNCAGSGDYVETQQIMERDSLLSDYIKRNDRFQKVAMKKMKSYDKDIKALKSTQGKIKKQLTAVIKKMRSLNKQLAKGGAPSADVLSDLKSLETKLTSLEESINTGVIMSDDSEVQTILQDDRDIIKGKYGEPKEKYIVDSSYLVWLYEKGVVVFDLAGNIISEDMNY